MSISASEARQRLFPLLEQVNTDHEPVRITSKGGDAVLMSADDYDKWLAIAKETSYKEFATVEGGQELIDKALAVE